MDDEKAKKVDNRARNWSLVVYPESAPENWRDILDDYHIPWVESHFMIKMLILMEK